ncbi:MAG: SpoIIE family protein phosphatase [Candidatus Riflebacteria bacterium]|nr:SpoIIE family protein phosphatase [Candidatus Riflebacteria bacterium]
MRHSLKRNALRRFGLRLRKLVKEIDLLDLLIQKSVTVRSREDLAHLFGEIIPGLLRVTRASLVLCAQNQKYFIFESLGVNPEIKGSSFLRTSPVIEWVFTHRKTLLVNDITTDERFKISKRSDYKTFCFMCIPVFMDYDLIGAISFSDPKNRRTFTKRDQELGEIVAGQFGILFRSIFLEEQQKDRKKFLEELNIAKTIQKRMLQIELPQIAAFDSSVRLYSALEVGGDLYYMAPKGNGGWVALVGDVAGKGVPAALTMVFSISQLKEIAEKADNPGQLLTTLHHTICDVLTDFQYLTACAVFFDEKTNKIQFTNAGHPSILLCKHDSGKLIELKNSGMAIGMFADNFETSLESIEFCPGDAILLYTDGCLDARSRTGEKYGTKRFYEAFQKNFRLSSDEIIERLQSLLNEFMTGVVPYDDITMLCIKREI